MSKDVTNLASTDKNFPRVRRRHIKEKADKIQRLTRLTGWMKWKLQTMCTLRLEA